MRALTLHISALNDSEYDSYTDALNDLTPDANTGPATDEFYDKISVGVREVRAWLRGRYSTLPVADVDVILKLFSPTLSPKDMLNGGQFFAVMRLVMHARDGKGIETAFAFVQAHPESISPSPSRPPPLKPPPPPPPARRFSQVTAFSEPDHNPFRAAATKPQPPPKPPQHPDNSMASTSSLQAPVPPPKSTNPFLSRSKSDGRNHESAKPKQPPLPPRKPASLLSSQQQQQPLPPPFRTAPLIPSNPVGKSIKPAHVLSPLMGRSLEASRVAHTQRKADESLESERVLQVLRSSSVNGSTGSLKNFSSSPPKLGSPSTTISTSSVSSSDGKNPYKKSPFANLPVLPPRLKGPGSVADSTMSFEQVANASVGNKRYSRSTTVTPLLSRSPERVREIAAAVAGDDEPRASSVSPTRRANMTPPPTHPDRKPPPISVEPSSPQSISSAYYPLSPTSPRIFRSKSMHHQKQPPPPPVRNARKRPESEQLSPAVSMFNLHSAGAPDPPATPGFSNLTRRVSLSSTHSRASSIDSSPMKRNIQKTLSSFQPKLDAARYKAEAGLSRRGYVNHTTPGPAAFRNWAAEGEQSLIEDDDSATVDGSSSFSFDDDAEGPFASPRTPGPASGRSKVLQDGALERDEMKWPAGDGWRPL